MNRKLFRTISLTMAMATMLACTSFASAYKVKKNTLNLQKPNGTTITATQQPGRTIGVGSGVQTTNVALAGESATQVAGAIPEGTYSFSTKTFKITYADTSMVVAETYNVDVENDMATDILIPDGKGGFATKADPSGRYITIAYDATTSSIVLAYSYGGTEVYVKTA